MGHGSEVREHSLMMGRGENLFWGSCSGFFGEMSCCNDIPTKRSKDELESLGACHEGQEERESTHTVASKSATANKQIK